MKAKKITTYTVHGRILTATQIRALAYLDLDPGAEMAVGKGCHVSRETAAALAKSGLTAPAPAGFARIAPRGQDWLAQYHYETRPSFDAVVPLQGPTAGELRELAARAAADAAAAPAEEPAPVAQTYGALTAVKMQQPRWKGWWMVVESNPDPQAGDTLPRRVLARNTKREALEAAHDFMRNVRRGVSLFREMQFADAPVDAQTAQIEQAETQTGFTATLSAETRQEIAEEPAPETVRSSGHPAAVASAPAASTTVDTAQAAAAVFVVLAHDTGEQLYATPRAALAIDFIENVGPRCGGATLVRQAPGEPLAITGRHDGKRWMTQTARKAS